jgi:GDP-L-fucose synthase
MKETVAKIYAAGHRGMVGSALVRRLLQAGYGNPDLHACRAGPARPGPDLAFSGAVKAGLHFHHGGHRRRHRANNTLRADFIYQNPMVEAKLIHCAWLADVQRPCFFGSSCIYPRDCPQPIKEDYLLTDLYGPDDHNDPANNHVLLPALIRKAHEAKQRGDSELVVWGSGKPMREFLYVDDLAEACVFLMQKGVGDDFYNVGAGTDVTIRELAETVMSVVGFAGNIVFDSSKPDGTPHKLLDVSRLRDIGWQAHTPLREGIALAYRDFLARHAG